MRGGLTFKGLLLPASTAPGAYLLTIRDATFDPAVTPGVALPGDPCGTLLRPLKPLSLPVTVLPAPAPEPEPAGGAAPAAAPGKKGKGKK